MTILKRSVHNDTKEKEMIIILPLVVLFLIVLLDHIFPPESMRTPCKTNVKQDDA